VALTVVDECACEPQQSAGARSPPSPRKRSRSGGRDRLRGPRPVPPSGGAYPFPARGQPLIRSVSIIAPRPIAPRAENEISSSPAPGAPRRDDRDLQLPSSGTGCGAAPGAECRKARPLPAGRELHSVHVCTHRAVVDVPDCRKRGHSPSGPRRVLRRFSSRVRCLPAFAELALRAPVRGRTGDPGRRGAAPPGAGEDEIVIPFRSGADGTRTMSTDRYFMAAPWLEGIRAALALYRLVVPRSGPFTERESASGDGGESSSPGRGLEARSASSTT